MNTSSRTDNASTSTAGTTDPLRATFEVEDGHVRITCDVEDISLTVGDEEHTAAVFLTADDAAVIAQVLSRASVRVTHPAVASALDAGDVKGAARVYLDQLEGAGTD